MSDYKLVQINVKFVFVRHLMPMSSEHMVCFKTSKFTANIYFEIFNLNYGSRGDFYLYLFTTNQVEI